MIKEMQGNTNPDIAKILESLNKQDLEKYNIVEILTSNGVSKSVFAEFLYLYDKYIYFCSMESEHIDNILTKVKKYNMNSEFSTYMEELYNYVLVPTDEGQTKIHNEMENILNKAKLGFTRANIEDIITIYLARPFTHIYKFTDAECLHLSSYKKESDFKTDIRREAIEEYIRLNTRYEEI